MGDQMGMPTSMSQSNTNPNNTTPTTKSHLAEILGKAEMHQLTSMSRALEPNQTPNGPTGQPGQPHMPGQGPPRPTQQPGMNPMGMNPGGFNPQMGNYPNMPQFMPNMQPHG